MRTRLTNYLAASSLALSCFVAANSAHAHGIIGHMHVTAWAIENLPDGELRDFFSDPEVFQAAVTGAMFPDTGYPLDKPAAREYAEYSHWEPFIDRFIEHVREAYGPTYDSLEEQKIVAFLMGCASHGLQDELFDSTFLHEVEQRDGRGQEVTDPATDGFLVIDGNFRHVPGDFVPYDDIVPLYGVLNQPIDEALIESQFRVVRNTYANDVIGPAVARNYGMRARSQIPWGAANYMVPGIAGSLGSEIEPTMRHLLALWERLHGRFDEANLVVHTWPDAPRRVREAQQGSVASWVTMVFGKGVQQDSASTTLVDRNGNPHPFQLRYTRWGGTSRLIRFQTTADYVPGEIYTATMLPGARLVDGTVTTHEHRLNFQVECSEPGDARCPPVNVTDDPGTRPLTPTPVPTDTPVPSPTATATSTPPHRGGGSSGCNATTAGADPVALAWLLLILPAFRSRRS